MADKLKEIDKEEYLIFKIFNSVKEKFTKWITGYFIIITALLSYIGIKTYNDISTNITI